MRYGGQFGEARKREYDNLGSIKMKFHLFKVITTLKLILSGRRR